MEKSGGRQYDWRDDANCLGKDREIFFPLGHVSAADRAKIAESKAICAGCKVSEQCLETAITKRWDCGTWGGQTEWERKGNRNEKRRRQLAVRAQAVVEAESKQNEEGLAS